MSQEPLVSIIIPTFNRAHLIGETLDSVLAQTYQNWECIVVDDGSTDDTDAVMKTYCDKDARFKYYHRPDEHLPGGNGARNYGFKMSQGEYINWFDSDDLMHKEKLKHQMYAIQSSKGDLCICYTKIFGDTDEDFDRLNTKSLYSENPFVSFVKREIVFRTQAPLIKRKLINKYKLVFDEELKASQEWEFFSRLLFYNNTFHIIDEELVYYRRHDGSISSQTSAEKLKHYYMAKLKVFRMIKGSEYETLLNSFFVNTFNSFFRRFLFMKSYKYAKHSLDHEIRKYSGFYYYLKASLIYQVFKFFGKGYYLRKFL
ncbi:glycosyltransferase family 2 protein [Psychroflexus halocasei]|uniref:Glycosyltransferase involved in cell wall bisynthesis n=1 Tax=Psychroflexus halocasei TaxID=908615 RepID=A0A1H4C2K4_9FLAO|nr:glycosyltransferase family 2 protein [Psychroflexus halocasei]SEA54641.1 Glycosyltransferase involved in cell wall bisynthesis [Psychroflexus halocasei]